MCRFLFSRLHFCRTNGPILFCLCCLLFLAVDRAAPNPIWGSCSGLNENMLLAGRILAIGFGLVLSVFVFVPLGLARSTFKCRKSFMYRSLYLVHRNAQWYWSNHTHVILYTFCYASQMACVVAGILVIHLISSACEQTSSTKTLASLIGMATAILVWFIVFKTPSLFKYWYHKETCSEAFIMKFGLDSNDCLCCASWFSEPMCLCSCSCALPCSRGSDTLVVPTGEEVIQTRRRSSLVDWMRRGSTGGFVMKAYDPAVLAKPIKVEKQVPKTRLQRMKERQAAAARGS